MQRSNGGGAATLRQVGIDAPTVTTATAVGWIEAADGLCLRGVLHILTTLMHHRSETPSNWLT